MTIRIYDKLNPAREPFEYEFSTWRRMAIFTIGVLTVLNLDEYRIAIEEKA